MIVLLTFLAYDNDNYTKASWWDHITDVKIIVSTAFLNGGNQIEYHGIIPITLLVHCLILSKYKDQ